MLKDIPVGRRISDTLYLAPGVSSSGSAGRANPSISGSTGLDNQYVVDGVNITNQGYGALGSYSIVFGSLGNATPFDFVQEVQVKTGGYEAEFGQSTGGVVNVITKSGSNDLHGSVFGYARPSGRRGRLDKQFQSVNGTVQTIGGPRISTAASKAAARSSRTTCSSSARSTRAARRARSTPRQGFPLLEPRGRRSQADDRCRTRRRARGRSSNAHRLDASFFGDPSKGEIGPQRVIAR